jgi:hypothetical protein
MAVGRECLFDELDHANSEIDKAIFEVIRLSPTAHSNAS